MHRVAANTFDDAIRERCASKRETEQISTIRSKARSRPPLEQVGSRSEFFCVRRGESGRFNGASASIRHPRMSIQAVVCVTRSGKAGGDDLNNRVTGG